jgi:hypothetical protein
MRAGEFAGLVRYSLIFDAFVKSQKTAFFVILAKAGIQSRDGGITPIY